MSQTLQSLTEAGVSIWLDDLSRERIVSGNLRWLIEEFSVRGVTTNPTIFAAALKTSAYSDAISGERARSSSVDEAVFNITTEDVTAACDLFLPTYQKTSGVDGRVSIEVSPELANSTEQTVDQAVALFKKVNRENVMIKIPATLAGLPAISEVLSRGISVNVTLIFSLERYAAVIQAFFEGLRRATAQNFDLSKVHSVASFFVSRVDTEVDRRLIELGRDDLKSKAAIANARLAYQLFLQEFSSPQWSELAAKGACVQRPLMASTGVKDPALPDTYYVSALIAEQVVNTMPEKTMLAMADHGVVSGDSITPNFADAEDCMLELARAGIDMASITELLEREGVEKFFASWRELLQSVSSALDNA
jgi:transaldolase